MKTLKKNLNKKIRNKRDKLIFLRQQTNNIIDVVDFEELNNYHPELNLDKSNNYIILNNQLH